MNPIPIPYRFLAAAVVWLVSIAAVGWWQRSDGIAVTQAKWEAREATQQAQAATQIKAMQDAARATEQKRVADMAALATDYERKIDALQKQRAADIAAVRAGALRLRDKSGTCMSAGANPAAKTSAGPGLGNGSEGCELSEQATEFLYGLANDADQVAEQLATCQRVIVRDRETGPP